MPIRFVNLNGRAGLQFGDRVADVETVSGGTFSADPMAVLQRWQEFVTWAQTVNEGDAAITLDDAKLGAPVPRPWKVFGVGMNYREHAKEAGLEIPGAPVIFAKFPNCICGPCAAVELSSPFVDWEVELVVAIGRGGRRIPESQAFDYIAGYMVGQDISDRKIQFTDTPPQFSMGKSIDSFGPTGPALVTTDAFANPNDLALTCHVGGERMQEARSSDLIFPVAALVAFLSKSCTLAPGDLIFTGTPAGVGSTRNPRRYLKPGDEIVSTIETIGMLRNRCVAE